MSRNFLSMNEELRNGDSLISNDGGFKAVFQDDGNFVIYGWKSTWESNTCGTKSQRLCMQKDGNLVIYLQNNKTTWASNSKTPGCNVCRLRLQDDGNLVVESEDKVLWNSRTSTNCPY